MSDNEQQNEEIPKNKTKSASWLGLDGENEIDASLENAFKKDEFEGTQGHAMLELKKTYKGDSRFKLTKLFVGDIETKKLPNKVKFQLTETELKDTDKKVKNIGNLILNKNLVDDDTEMIKIEKKKGLEILAEIVPKSELHFNLKKFEEKNILDPVQPIKTKGKYSVPRYDPLLKKGAELIVPEKPKKIEEKPNEPKLSKADKLKAKYKKLMEKKKAKMKKPKVPLEDAIPDESKVEINTDWKQIISQEKTDKTAFKLFDLDGDTNKSPFEIKENQIKSKQKVEKIENNMQKRKGPENQNVEKIEQNGKKVKKVEETSEKDNENEESSENIQENDEKSENSEISEISENEEEKKKKKKKKKKKWLKKIEGEKLKELYTKEFGMTEEQFENHQRYVNMIFEKRKKQHLI